MFQVYDSVVQEEVGEFDNREAAEVFAKVCASSRAKQYLKDTEHPTKSFDYILGLALPKFIIIDEDEKYIKDETAVSPQNMFGFETVEKLGEALQEHPAKSRFVSIATIVTTMRLFESEAYIVASILIEGMVGVSMKKNAGSLFSYLENNLDTDQLAKIARELIMVSVAFCSDE